MPALTLAPSPLEHLAAVEVDARRLRQVLEPTRGLEHLAADELEAVLGAIADRLEVADQAERGRLLRGRAALELELARRLES